MTARLIEWEDKPFALLIENQQGEPLYVVPPIVRDGDGTIVEGQEILMAIVESGVAVRLPVVHGASPGDLAEVDRRMALVSEQLGVPTLAQWLGSSE